jgi:hypothetical protein
MPQATLLECLLENMRRPRDLLTAAELRAILERVKSESGE